MAPADAELIAALRDAISKEQRFGWKGESARTDLDAIWLRLIELMDKRWQSKKAKGG